jgi:hypothetical protein
LLTTPPASLRTSATPAFRPGSRRGCGGIPVGEGGACCAGAATGTVAEGRPNGGMLLSSSSGSTRLSSRRAAGPGGPAVRDVGRGLTLARRASAHQASAGRWTAAGDHAPIVERSIANQQQPHHHHQADPWILPRQPAPRGTVGAQEPSDSPESPKLACPVEQPLTLPVCWTLTASSAWPFGLSCCVSLAWERTGAPALLGGIDHTSMACRTCSLAWVGLADLCAGLAMRLVRPAGHIYSLRWLTIAVLSSAGGESSG